MDAKNKANFINSVAGGQVIPCPNCSTTNKPDSKRCISCGAKLSAPTDVNGAPAFEPVAENPPQTTGKAAKYVEPASVFAEGLPSWDIVPPQVMVRRR